MRNFAHTGKETPGGIATKFCMSVDIHDVITCATFCDDRLRGFGVAMGRISRFPIDLRRRPYNTLALSCECVIVCTVRDETTQSENNITTGCNLAMYSG